MLQGLRNQRIDAADLTRFGHPLALVSVTLQAGAPLRLPDLCDPAVLVRYDIHPDLLASWDFTRTRAIARQLFAAGCAGFRWWSALAGDWHTTVLFHAAVSQTALRLGPPQPLTMRTEAVTEAARRLAIRLS